MAVLTKLISGNVYEETFETLNLMWEVYPDKNRIVMSNGMATLQHGNERCSMLMPCPSDDFVYQVKINYKPISPFDIAGLLVYSTSTDTLECQIYYNQTLNNNQYYTHLKIVKERTVYSFYGSKDSIVWELIGTSDFPDANKIGFFLDGPKTDISSNLSIEHIQIYKSNVLIFDNMPNTYTVSINDPMQRCIAQKQMPDSGKLVFDFKDYLFPLDDYGIKITDWNDNVVSSVINQKLIGGDIYTVKLNVNIYIDNGLINPTEAFSFGKIGLHGTSVIIKIVNNDVEPLIGKTLKVVQYSDYYAGSKFAKLAVMSDPNKNIVNTDFSDSVVIPDLSFNDVCYIKLNIERDASNTSPFYAEEYRFKLILD